MYSVNGRWSKSDSPSTVLKKRAGLQKHLWQGYSLICYEANWNAIQVRDLTSVVLIFRELVFTSAIFRADSSHPIIPWSPPSGFCLAKKCFFCALNCDGSSRTLQVYIQEWFPAPKQSIYYKTRLFLLHWKKKYTEWYSKKDPSYGLLIRQREWRISENLWKLFLFQLSSAMQLFSGLMSMCLAITEVLL